MTIRRALMAAALATAGVAVAASAVEAQRWGRPRPPRAGACFYQNANFGGDYFCVDAGDGYDQMPEGLNDRISSVRVFGDADVTVYRDPAFRGRNQRFDEDHSNLQIVGWNDTISSLRVQRRNGGFGGRGNAGRNERRLSREEAEDMVRRAYQSVLRRDPDPGARGFVDQVIRNGWSQRDVERELRNSPEYRNRRPPQ